MKIDKDLIGHDTKTESRIFRRYAEICEKKKDICANCREKEKEIQKINDGLPVSFFIVGADMKTTKYRVMFVGKTVTSNWGPKAVPPDPIEELSVFIDARFNSENLFLKQDRMFFKCIGSVCQLLWNEDNLDLEKVWRRIAVTDFTKCSNSEGWAKTTPEMKNNCMEAGFLKAEIEEAQPTHLIFFTGHDYDDQIKKLFDLPYEIMDEPNDEIKIWWIRKSDQNEKQMQMLRTYHPHYFHYNPNKKELFSQKIASWIKKS